MSRLRSLGLASALLIARPPPRAPVPLARRLSSAATPHTEPGPATTLSENETMLIDSVHQFCAKHVRPTALEADRAGVFPPELLPSLFPAGIMAIETPERFHENAAGLSFSCAVLAVEAVATHDPAVAIVVDIHNTLTSEAVRRYATDEQKERWLPGMAESWVSSFCLSEAASGSDAFALRTTAKPSADGSKYVLNGSKMWVSNAAEAELFIIFASVDLAKKHKGITAFVVRRGTPGLEIGKKEDKMGIRASSTCELFLNDVVVDAADRLGPEGHGYKIAMAALNPGRIGIAAQMTGLARGALDITIPHLFARKQFGAPLIENQGLRFQVAQAEADLDAARALMLDAARRRDAALLGGNGYGSGDGVAPVDAPELVRAAAVAKLVASQTAERVASRCVEWAGGVGFTRDFGVEKLFRDAKIGQIYEGTTNIHLNTIAKLALKRYEP
mmetsp:Transcript_2919/g.7627  ORF Transcript_2919/g.7627 Transcript_2919/m.7627 type:complete len:446 (-) Transcript_2919:16-1353(-)|eukprot:CAMPEP_0174902686 /NCGR_PEP_ID=MMETSP0167-20121228/39314_1 /TAXON_ID=38298 /ORGANISM="Rhodella maculata, Strain CCMP736" /LENGTH=445 /DNA_ID=CAMNT_0016144779 /DNA_START=119 /DNA_END=1456 /DNA_ORIENTATION=+